MVATSINMHAVYFSVSEWWQIRRPSGLEIRRNTELSTSKLKKKKCCSVNTLKSKIEVHLNPLLTNRGILKYMLHNLAGILTVILQFLFH